MIVTDKYDNVLSVGDNIVVKTRSYGSETIRKAVITEFTKDKILFIAKNVKTKWDKDNKGCWGERTLGIIEKKSFTWTAYGRIEENYRAWNVIKI